MTGCSSTGDLARVLLQFHIAQKIPSDDTQSLRISRRTELIAVQWYMIPGTCKLMFCYAALADSTDEQIVDPQDKGESSKVQRTGTEDVAPWVYFFQRRRL